MRLTLDEVYDLAFRALLGSETSEPNARIMAESIRDGEAEGIRNVALGYLPVYCEHARVGKVNGHAVPDVRQLAPAVVNVDAHDGFCHPAFVAGEGRLVALARSQGIAALIIERSSSAGILGWFFDRLARQGLVALGFANSSALMASHGGSKRFFGTNPIGLGAPRGSGDPLVVDMSSSATAYVNVANAAARGESIPPQWAQDADGRPTTDPQAVLEGGAMAPAAGHKGMALALMVDVMAAGLSGSDWSHEASDFGTNEGGPVNVGQFFLAVDPSRLGVDGFGSRLEAMLAVMATEDGVRIPGERRHASRRSATLAGVDVDDELVSLLERYTA